MEVTIWHSGSKGFPEISHHCLFGFNEDEYDRVKEFNEIQLNEYNGKDISSRKYIYIISIDDKEKEFDKQILAFLNKVIPKLSYLSTIIN